MRPKACPIRRVKKLGVLGAGMMGAGIALVSAQAGIEVCLIDRDQEAPTRARAYTEKPIWTRASPRQGHAEKKEAMLALITATPIWSSSRRAT